MDLVVRSMLILVGHIKQELFIIIVGLVQIREMNFHFPSLHGQPDDLLQILLPWPFLLRPFLQYLTSFLLMELLAASLGELSVALELGV